MTRFLFPVNVILLLHRDNRVLLIRRAQTGLYDGCWALPGGKIEQGESPRQAITREGHEELGLKLEPQLVTTLALRLKNEHQIAETYYDICMVFAATSDEEPTNREPIKHDRMEWFSIDHLPHPVAPLLTQAIQQWRENRCYGEVGYDHERS